MGGDGLLLALLRTWRYQRLGEEGRRKVREARLRRVIGVARARSPLYSSLYAGLPRNPGLSSLPPVTKRELMARFDEWPTDRSVRLEELRSFMADADNIGREFHRKYLVYATSGSTGNPTVVLYDRRARNVFSALGVLRGYAHKKDLMALVRAGKRVAGLYASGGFYLGAGGIRNVLLKMPWKRKVMRLVSVLDPLPSIVRELNDFQPAMLGGYPTALELLLDEVEAGRLRISPVVIMAGGESLSPGLRERLARAFSCHVQTTYSCTEGGILAGECAEGHLHVNEDWVIVEAVDEAGAAVPDGTRSEKILVTNLSNLAQPIIRYEVTDRVTMHREGCACGSSLPWLEIDGRSDEVLDFASGGRRVRIAPLALYARIRETAGLRRFQLVQGPDGGLELRMECSEGHDRVAVFRSAAQGIEALLAANGVRGTRIDLAPELPSPDPRSGKFRHVFKAASR
jgi:phenylacetate-coenzyme A ligase PaaK-like adenylate-forming protein